MRALTFNKCFPDIKKPQVNRQLEITVLLREGKTEDEIADLLGIKKTSVQKYRQRHGVK